MVEKAKNYDFLNAEGTMQVFCKENLKDDKLILSAGVKTDGFLFFKKNRIIVLTDMYVYVLHNKKWTVRFKNNYLEIMGVTASLRIGATNFIMHFADRCDEEWVCEHRD